MCMHGSNSRFRLKVQTLFVSHRSPPSILLLPVLTCMPAHPTDIWKPLPGAQATPSASSGNAIRPENTQKVSPAEDLDDRLQFVSKAMSLLALWPCVLLPSSGSRTAPKFSLNGDCLILILVCRGTRYLGTNMSNSFPAKNNNKNILHTMQWERKSKDGMLDSLLQSMVTVLSWVENDTILLLNLPPQHVVSFFPVLGDK